MNLEQQPDGSIKVTARRSPWWALPLLLIINGLIALAVWLALKGAT